MDTSSHSEELELNLDNRGEPQSCTASHTVADLNVKDSHDDVEEEPRVAPGLFLFRARCSRPWSDERASYRLRFPPHAGSRCLPLGYTSSIPEPDPSGPSSMGCGVRC